MKLVKVAAGGNPGHSAENPLYASDLGPNAILTVWFSSSI